MLTELNPDEGSDFVSASMDDVLVFSEGLEKHMEHLQLVFKRLIETGLKLNANKCQFIRQEVEYLGHVITVLGLKTSNQHVQAVCNFPTPGNFKEVRQFLGLSSYYRRFVPSFAKILHALTRKTATFKWSEECQTAFETLRQRLVEAPVLAYPTCDNSYVLETDASIQGLGAILSQAQADGHLHPVAFASRALAPPEKKLRD